MTADSVYENSVEFVSGGHRPPLQIRAYMRKTCGCKSASPMLNKTPLLPLAWINEQIARATGRAPFLTLDSLRMARHRMFFSSAKARAQLGYRARPYREALVDAIDWITRPGSAPTPVTSG